MNEPPNLLNKPQTKKRLSLFLLLNSIQLSLSTRFQSFPATFSDHHHHGSTIIMGYTDQVRQLLKQVETDESVIVEDEKQLPPPTVQKTEEEWKKILTPKQYEVLRRAGTEPSFCGGYKTFKDQLKQNQQEEGVFHCSACDAPLFNAKTSFESGKSFQTICFMNIWVVSFEFFQ